MNGSLTVEISESRSRAQKERFKREREQEIQVTTLCPECEDDFTYTQKRPGSCRTYCDSCAALRAWRSGRKWQIKDRLTNEEYDQRLEDQGGVCAICGTDHSINSRGMPEQFHADHDHDTGRVRGLLCRGCNWTLGLHESGYRVNEKKFGAYLRRTA